MNGENRNASGISSGRRWTTLPVDGAPLEWSIDMDKGYVQGPLDLEFLRGQKLAVTLKPGQQALLVQEAELKAVFLEGTHYLDIGKSPHQIDPACQLIFLALDEPLQMRWTKAQPLQWGAGQNQSLIGNCVLHVEWPSRFHATFLAGHPCPEPGFTTRLIDQMLRGLLAEHLAGDLAGDGAPSESELQTRLTRLTPDDLNDELNACGLHCTHLALYTSAPPIEDEMRSNPAENPTHSH